ncbi:hypothetical protein C0991_010479, partial [Blastosporella zonata]
MSIELMTGPDESMVHLTTPPGTPGYGYAWTTRFPIASSSGQVVAAEHATQSDGTPHPWGTGALVDSSIASPPPFMTTGTTTTSATVTKPPTTSATPKTIAPGVVAGCTSFFTQTNPSLLCYQIASTFGITIGN